MNCAVNSPTGNIDARNQIHLHKKIIYFYAIDIPIHEYQKC